jgi:hypothetical protein
MIRKALPCFLALATFLVFARTLSAHFINLDDGLYVYSNPQVTSGLSWSGLRWAFTTGHATNWHPLTWLTLQLDATLYGVRPEMFHLTNLLLHIITVELLYIWCLGIVGSPWAAAAVAALFALHPLRVESVAWVSERKDVLSGAFWMMTLIAYDRYVRRPELKRYLFVLFSFAAGLLCKPMLVSLPLVLWILDYWPYRRVTRRSFLEKVPLAVLSLASALITLKVQSEGGAVKTLGVVSLWGRLLNAMISYGRYLEKLVFPVGLSPSYLYPGAVPALDVPTYVIHPSLGVGDGVVIVALLGLSALAWSPRSIRPGLVAPPSPSLLFCGLALVPRDAGAGHWDRPGRAAADGGSLYLPAARRARNGTRSLA